MYAPVVYNGLDEIVEYEFVYADGRVTTGAIMDGCFMHAGAAEATLTAINLSHDGVVLHSMDRETLRRMASGADTSDLGVLLLPSGLHATSDRRVHEISRETCGK
jgi:hypothetical protein